MPSQPSVALKPLTSWSFSRFSDYDKDLGGCPAKFKYKHLLKMAEPPNAAMQRGSDIHKEAEDFTKGALPKLPPNLQLFKDEFAALKKQKVKFVEEQWAFTKDWDLTAWNNWNACWLRVKLDVAYHVPAHNALVIIDHKTGKFREEQNAQYELQLELYGVAGLVQQPEVAVVSPRLWYLDEGRIYPDPEVLEIEYFRKDEKTLKKKWEARVAPMFADKKFDPKPSERACKWCHYRKANGGPCKY